MTFDERCREAAELFERGENGQALAIFEELSKDESVDNFGRAMMCLNIATVEAKQGSKLRVMNAYDRAAGLAIYAYLIVQDKRIDWLVTNNHTQNAVEAIERVLQIAELTRTDRANYEKKLKEVRRQSG